MRELKFRAWNKDSNDWLHDCMLKETVFGCTSGYKWNSVGGFAELHPNRDHPEYIIEQYTGLKDKNGQEIYDGDIVKADGRIYEVAWFEKDGGWFCFRENDSVYTPLYHLKGEVVGNIHENPELLENE